MRCLTFYTFTGHLNFLGKVIMSFSCVTNNFFSLLVIHRRAGDIINSEMYYFHQNENRLTLQSFLAITLPRGHFHKEYCCLEIIPYTYVIELNTSDNSILCFKTLQLRNLFQGLSI